MIVFFANIFPGMASKNENKCFEELILKYIIFSFVEIEKSIVLFSETYLENQKIVEYENYIKAIIKCI